jgi:ribosomal protein L7Ae-like RNA K-turn-binding protein
MFHIFLATKKSGPLLPAGQRRCQACGRAYTDLARLAQHLGDKHAGINTLQEDEVPQGPSRAFTLADALFRPPPTKPTPRPPHQQKQELKQPRHLERLHQTFNAPAPHPSSATLAPVLEPPPGTRLRSKKRPSRLKRAYRRTKALRAAASWAAALAEVEEAMQVNQEALESAVNELRLLGAGNDIVGLGDSEGSVRVRVQVLTVQAKEAAQRAERLLNAHGAARQELAAAQARLMKPSSSMVPDDNAAVQGKEKNGRHRPEGQHEAGTASIEAISADTGALNGMRSGSRIEEPIVHSDAEAQWASTEDEDALSSTATSSSSGTDGLAGFQNVLQIWSAASKPLSTAAKAQPVAGARPVVANRPRTVAEAAVEHGDDGSRQRHPVLQTLEAKDKEREVQAEEKAHFLPTYLSSGSSSSSSGGESSNGSFALQWGDALRGWASTMKTEAKRSTQDFKEREAPPPQQQQQRTGPVVESAPEPSMHPSSKAALASKEPAEADRPAPTQETMAESIASGDAKGEGPGSVDSGPFIDVHAWLLHAQPVADGPGPEQEPQHVQGRTEAGDAAATADLYPERVLPFLGKLSVAAAPFVAARAAVRLDDDGGAFKTQDSPPIKPGDHFCAACGAIVSGTANWSQHLAGARHLRKVTRLAAAELPPAPLSTTATSAAGTSLARPDGSGPAPAPYVTQACSAELDAEVDALLRQLHAWQERARAADPINAKRKRRLISGMREVLKAVKAGRVKALIMAPNIGALEPTDADAHPAAPDDVGAREEVGGGGAGESSYPVAGLLKAAEDKGVPVVFALSRRRLGRVLGQRKTASAFAVVDASGAEMGLKGVLRLAEEGRRRWGNGEDEARSGRVYV